MTIKICQNGVRILAPKNSMVCEVPSIILLLTSGRYAGIAN